MDDLTPKSDGSQVSFIRLADHMACDGLRLQNQMANFRSLKLCNEFLAKGCTDATYFNIMAFKNLIYFILCIYNIFMRRKFIGLTEVKGFTHEDRLRTSSQGADQNGHQLPPSLLSAFASSPNPWSLRGHALPLQLTLRLTVGTVPLCHGNLCSCRSADWSLVLMITCLIMWVTLLGGWAAFKNSARWAHTASLVGWVWWCSVFLSPSVLRSSETCSPVSPTVIVLPAEA